jgi:hypothetical protein
MLYMYRELTAAVSPAPNLTSTLRDWPAIVRQLAEPKRRRTRASLT